MKFSVCTTNSTQDLHCSFFSFTLCIRYHSHKVRQIPRHSLTQFYTSPKCSVVPIALRPASVEPTKVYTRGDLFKSMFSFLIYMLQEIIFTWCVKDCVNHWRRCVVRQKASCVQREWNINRLSFNPRQLNMIMIERTLCTMQKDFKSMFHSSLLVE